MGTILEITLVGRPGEISRDDLDPLFAEVQRLEAIFTRYDDASALSLLNAASGAGPRTVAPELADILADCVRYAELTRGRFDVTVGPLVELWRAAARRDRVPAPVQVAATRDRVGAAKLRLLPDAQVDLSRGMAVDLDGVAKGWALDRLAHRLREEDVAGALLDFGGSSVVALGAPPGEEGWRTLLRDTESGAAGTLVLRDRALAVSGSLGQWTTIAGRRYGHVIDPQSGEPMTRAFQAVVVAPTGGEAEAWTKALLVLGAEEGLALVAARPGVEGMLVDEEGRRFTTPGFREAAGFEAL